MEILFHLPDQARISGIKWSAPANRWVFTALSNGDSDIYLADWSGKQVKNLTNSPQVYEDEIDISPNGKMIAYSASSLSMNTFIGIIDIANQRNELWNKNHFFDRSPVWFDNNQLIFLSSMEGSPNIFKSSVKDRKNINLSAGQGLDTEFSLDKKNKYMAFISDRAGNKNVFLYDFQTQQISQITNNLGECSSPELSPDGSKIIFRTKQKEGYKLYLYFIADKKMTDITYTNDLIPLGFKWSENSEKIVYSAELNKQLDIFVYDVTSRTHTNITNSPAMDYSPGWVKKNK